MRRVKRKKSQAQPSKCGVWGGIRWVSIDTPGKEEKLAPKCSRLGVGMEGMTWWGLWQKHLAIAKFSKNASKELGVGRLSWLGDVYQTQRFTQCKKPLCLLFILYYYIGNIMKSDINIFTYDNYRIYLSDLLKQKGYSYRSFTDRFGHIVSLIALAKTLSKGRGGKGPRQIYRMSPEMLTQLGRALRIPESELRHLILMRLHNDAEIYSGQYGSSFQQMMGRLVKESRLTAGLMEHPKVKLKHSSNSETGGVLLEIFELLPSRFRVRVLEEFTHQAKIYATRQTGKPGVKAFQSLLKRLNRLREMGAP